MSDKTVKQWMDEGLLPARQNDAGDDSAGDFVMGDGIGVGKNAVKESDKDKNRVIVIDKDKDDKIIENDSNGVGGAAGDKGGSFDGDFDVDFDGSFDGGFDGSGYSSVDGNDDGSGDSVNNIVNDSVDTSDGSDNDSAKSSGGGGAKKVAQRPNRAERAEAKRAEKAAKKAAKKAPGTRPVRRRKRRKRRFVVILIIIAAVGYFAYASMSDDTRDIKQVRYSVVERGDLRSVVSVRGNVQSDVKRNVYSTLSLMVESVEVSVGDAVDNGQVLCMLDKEDLELNIEQQNAELNAAIQNNEKQIESNEKIYNDAAESLQSGSNAQILNAQAAVRNAQVSLETAQANYDNLLYDYNNGTNANCLSAESSVVSAKNDLDTREREYENNKLLFAAGAITQEALNQSEIALNNAHIRHGDALTNLDNAKTAEARALEQSRNSLRSAQTAYSNAQTSLASAERAAEQELERYESNVETSRIGANVESRLIALKKLEKQLEESEIRSPVSGVITAVYAKEGSSGSGLLFVVEDPDQLKITIRVKEYDAGKLVPGMPVIIKADAIAGAEYYGTLTKIDPAAVKNAMGETDTISDIEFGAEVSIDSTDTMLRIGMNARLDIIVEQRDNVFYVPFDTLTENEAGNDVIYIVEDSEELGSIAREIPVNIGLETDFYIEIYGQRLTDGMRVINEAAGSDLFDGMPISFPGSLGRSANSGNGNGNGNGLQFNFGGMR
ncbi:MAG: efflux RND transporter periplasmic adaptor subunit [Oscillospiraceae bacterium]|nr:efflux RND transporter periplasmic adaptor subunit [Oscillospiraceae bacterium]